MTDSNENALEIQTPTVLETVSRAEYDVAIATAKRYPRSITQFKIDALAMATLDEETAESCFYILKRSQKIIEGPSVRLAEIVGSAWGNVRYGGRILSQDSRFIVAQGVCHDLEKNVSANVEVQRRITYKNGETYSDDMITVTANAAMAIALRNAIFKVIPVALCKGVYDEAKLVAAGDASTLLDRRQKALTFFNKRGIDDTRICATLGVRGIEDITGEHLSLLTGMKTAAKDGESSLDEQFPEVRDDPERDGDVIITRIHAMGRPLHKTAEGWNTYRRNACTLLSAGRTTHINDLTPDELLMLEAEVESLARNTADIGQNDKAKKKAGGK